MTVEILYDNKKLYKYLLSIFLNSYTPI